MKKKIKRVYLDVSALSRPFDNQAFLRIKLETEAVNLILSKIRAGEFDLVVSPVHWEEIGAISGAFERIELQERLKSLAEQRDAEFVSCDDSLIRKCSRHNIEIWCGNPVAFCEKEKLR